MSRVHILTGDCRDWLANLPSQSVHCVVTSPPYFGLRDYGVAGQIGLEPTIAEHIAALTDVFREVWRVLRDDGTLWLNYGDAYASGNRGSYASDAKNGAREKGSRPLTPDGLKPKDLIGLPWRLAFALQADGWCLRCDNIWHKPNPMPESVRDRPTRAHEYVFMFSKAPRYFYDGEAVKEACTSNDAPGARAKKGTLATGQFAPSGKNERMAQAMPERRRGHERKHAGFNERWDQMTKEEQQANGRNLRTVWTVAPKPFKGAHFATFPPALITPCIRAGSSEHGACYACGAPWKRQTAKKIGTDKASDVGRFLGSMTTIGWRPTCTCDSIPIPCTVLDPFGGSGTTGVVARALKRSAVLIEMNPDYVEMTKRRLVDAA